MSVPHISPRAALVAFGVIAFFGWGEIRNNQGYDEGFAEGRNPYTVPVEPNRVVCGPQYGLHDVTPGETANSIAALYGIDTNTMLRVNNKLNADGSFTPSNLTDSDCLRVDSAAYVSTPTPTGEYFGGTPVGQLR